MVPTLATHVAATASITDGHAMIATHFTFAAWFTRRLFTILAACARRHDIPRVWCEVVRFIPSMNSGGRIDIERHVHDDRHDGPH
jgi:hypothetical protein